VNVLEMAVSVSRARREWTTEHSSYATRKLASLVNPGWSPAAGRTALPAPAAVVSADGAGVDEHLHADV
jgi:hypothetical protein